MANSNLHQIAFTRYQLENATDLYWSEQIDEMNGDAKSPTDEPITTAVLLLGALKELAGGVLGSIGSKAWSRWNGELTMEQGFDDLQKYIADLLDQKLKEQDLRRAKSLLFSGDLNREAYALFTPNSGEPESAKALGHFNNAFAAYSEALGMAQELPVVCAAFYSKVGGGLIALLEDAMLHNPKEKQYGEHCEQVCTTHILPPINHIMRRVQHDAAGQFFPPFRGATIAVMGMHCFQFRGETFGSPTAERAQEMAIEKWDDHMGGVRSTILSPLHQLKDTCRKARKNTEKQISKSK